MARSRRNGTRTRRLTDGFDDSGILNYDAKVRKNEVMAIPEAATRRVPLSLRVPPKTRDMLVAAARDSGRSLTTEIEFRLCNSFEYGELLDLIKSLLLSQRMRQRSKY
jgi:hypothetical protein